MLRWRQDRVIELRTYPVPHMAVLPGFFAASKLDAPLPSLIRPDGAADVKAKSKVVIEVGAPGPLPWLPRDSLKEGDFHRLDRIVEELTGRGFNVEVRQLDVSPPCVFFRRGDCRQVLYIADHIREFYADGGGPPADSIVLSSGCLTVFVLR